MGWYVLMWFHCRSVAYLYLFNCWHKLTLDERMTSFLSLFLLLGEKKTFSVFDLIGPLWRTYWRCTKTRTTSDYPLLTERSQTMNQMKKDERDNMSEKMTGKRSGGWANQEVYDLGMRRKKKQLVIAELNLWQKVKYDITVLEKYKQTTHRSLFPGKKKPLQREESL